MARALIGWFAAVARDLPWRRGRDPYGIWVSEVMLQQTQVATVVPYWERWMREFPDARAVATAHPDRLLKAWEGLGYYTRVRNLQRAARAVVEHYGGRLPRAFAEWRALPGIGRYTAGAICSLAFDDPVPVLDGNVARVLTRWYGIRADPRRSDIQKRLWSLADELVVAAHRQPGASRLLRDARSPGARHVAGPCSALNQALMELGARVCTPRDPGCATCPVRAGCVAHARGLTGQIPARRKGPVITERQFLAFVIEEERRWLVVRRPPDVVNGGLYEFPNVEIKPGGAVGRGAGRVARRWFGGLVQRCERIGEIRHAITRYRLRVHVFRLQAVPLPSAATTTTAVRRLRWLQAMAPGPLAEAAEWVGRSWLVQLPLTAAHGRIRRLMIEGTAGL